MNRQFADYTKLSAFQITLSQRQAQVLLSVAEGDYFLKYSHFVTTVGCLMAKGLVTHTPPGEDDEPGYFTTRAGALVYQLLLEAGWSNVTD